jgi:hypothetical protein
MLLKHAESLETVAIGLAYGLFYVIRFHCPIHREKCHHVSQKPPLLCNENSSTDFTARLRNIAKSSTLFDQT